MRYDAAEINRFDLTRYPDYRGDFPPDVYQLHRFGHLEEYEAEWGRRWGANGIGRLRDVALSRPTEYEVLDLWLKHPKFFLLRYSSRIDLDALVRNHEAYDALLRSLGIDVHWIEYDHPFARGRVGGTVLINHFTADLCRSYQYDLSARGLAISTIRLRLATLGSFGKWAVRRERVDKNPLDLLTRPQRKEQLSHLPSTATAEKIIAQSSGRR